MDNKISRNTLIKDIRELSTILESAHPDPYIKGGGKIAYHRRLQELIRDVPKGGMIKEEFYHYIRPFIASLKDGHTNLNPLQTVIDKENPGGIPLYFEPIDEKLYVSAVTKEEYLSFIGYQLVSVEEIPFDELVDRLKNQIGIDNQYGLLEFLGKLNILYFKHYLKLLIPEWKDELKIKLQLRNLDCKIEDYTLDPAKEVNYPLKRPESKVSLKDLKGWISYHFLGEKESIAYLRIESMSAYREAHEYWNNIGMKQFIDLSKKIYFSYNNKAPPEDMNELLQGIPAVSDLFVLMLKEMKTKNSKNLLVDLRKCPGGYDLIILFLVYFLAGFDMAITQQLARREIQKYSKLFEESSKEGLDLGKISYYSQVPLTVNDYDFSNDSLFQSDKERRKSVEKGFIEEFKKMPSFYKYFKTREYEAFYLPKNIYVLCSSLTASSAFDMMVNLIQLGAKTIGVPSKQSGNSFGNVRFFKLQNSEITGYVATKYFQNFPVDSEKGTILLPDYQLTYKKLVSLNFDPNAAVLYALEILKE